MVGWRKGWRGACGGAAAAWLEFGWWVGEYDGAEKQGKEIKKERTRKHTHIYNWLVLLFTFARFSFSLLAGVASAALGLSLLPLLIPLGKFQ